MTVDDERAMLYGEHLPHTSCRGTNAGARCSSRAAAFRPVRRGGPRDWALRVAAGKLSSTLEEPGPALDAQRSGARRDLRSAGLAPLGRPRWSLIPGRFCFCFVSTWIACGRTDTEPAARFD